MNYIVNEQQFIELYDTYVDNIFRHCYFRVSNKEKAWDLTQETFVKAWAHVTKNRSIDNAKAFLYTIANNLIIDWYRKKKEESLDQLQEQGFDPSGNDHQKLLNSVEFNHLTRLIDNMDPKYRDVLIMSYIDDLSHKEIALILNETENNVAVRIHRGIKKLKELTNQGTRGGKKHVPLEPKLRLY